jgi:mono/diheme cytochrome c family protein
MTFAKRVLGVLLLLGAPIVGSAQDLALGRVEYMANCAQCHGIGGRGDGVIAGYLTMPPADLTALARGSGGMLREDEIYATIEGSRRPGPHGTREMPAWGERYSVEAAEAYGFTYTPAEQTDFIHRRISALVDYVVSLQEP